MDGTTNLTRNQVLIWLGQELTPQLPVFNELTVFVLDGAIDRARFDAALQSVIDRTDALRTVVRRAGVLPTLEVLPALPYHSAYVDLSVEADPEAALDRWARAHVDTMLDLSQRVFESTLIKLSPVRYAWALLQHHILSDATSMGLVFQRVGACYQENAAGTPDGAAHFPSFADYVRHEQAQRQTPAYAEREAYWEARTSILSDPLVFYGGKTRPAANGVPLARVELNFDAERSAALRRLSGRDGIRFLSDELSMFSVLAAVFVAYLTRLTGQRRIAVGVPWQNRPRQFSETVGLLMEQDPLVVALDDDETFESLIRKVQREAIDAMRHLPYSAGNPSGHVYEVGFNYLKTSLGPFGDIPVTPRWYRPTAGAGSLVLQVHDLAGTGGLSLSFDFNATLFDEADRRSATSHFMTCLDACMEDAGRLIRSFSLLGPDERRVLEAWNATAQEYPRAQTVLDLVEAQVARTPAAEAVRGEDRSYSYAELDRRASAIAGVLRRHGVAPGVLVGVCVERSPDMLAGVLGILKAGGAYVPLDPAFPADRLAFMLEDSGAPVVVTQTRLAGLVARAGVTAIDLDTLALDAAASGPAEGARATPQDLAYVLYTSGSTGKPKGVEIPHQALTNFLWAMRETPGCTAADVVLAVTTLSFDIAGLELWLPLITGGRVEIASRAVAADGRRLRARLDAGDITILQATPVTWRMLLEAGWTGTPGLKALIGGEPLPPDLVPPLLDRTASLWNMYGPTETTIWSSVQPVTRAAEEITVGRPIANTTFYILDEHGAPVPIGVAGELYIGGDGLARGYRGRPELTAEKFVADPFSAVPGARLYRTGDLARYRADGQVLHLGRLDHQVKVRGFRIELGEIEAALARHAGVQQAVVVAREDQPGHAMLVAYWVPAAPAPTPAELRAHLQQTLPDYMVPQHFVALERLPLTPNGKIDRKQLPAPEIGAVVAAAHVAPRTPTEAQVAAAFGEVLQLPAVSADGDFFELGGQSLLAIRLMSRLEAAFGVQLPLQVLFEASTVAALADRVCDVTGGERPSVAPSSTSGRPARTVTERRLAAIWSDVLGSHEPIPVDASFLTLQGARSLVIPMLAEVRKAFGVYAEGISAVTFEARPTIEALAEDIDGAAQPSSLVVPLQPHGNRTPVFLIHAGGGYVFFYRALAARIGPDQPVYGVRAVTSDDKPGPSFDRSESVEALAARYISEIKTIQRHGPYRLGGACFGGVIAFEMARQLTAAGETIEGPLLLFDSYIIDVVQGPRAFWADSAEHYVLKRATAHLDRSHGLGRLGAARYLAGRALRNIPEALRLVPAGARAAWRRISTYQVPEEWRWRLDRLRGRPIPIERVQQRTMERFLETTFRLLRRYQPKPYHGPAVLFRASVGDDPAPDWRPLLPAGLDVHDMPGVHLDMMEEPVVVDTAALARRYLGIDAVAAADREQR